MRDLQKQQVDNTKEINDNIARSSNDSRIQLNNVQLDLGGKLDLLLQRGRGNGEKPAEEENPVQVETPIEIPAQVKEIPAQVETPVSKMEAVEAMEANEKEEKADE